MNYTHICYVAKTALIPWVKLGERWKEFEASFAAKPQDNDGITGREYFPPYKLVIVAPEGRTQLVDYYVTERDRLRLDVESSGRQVRVIPVVGSTRAALNSDSEVALNPGYNDIGVHVQGAAEGYWRWLDFRRFKIHRNAPSGPPPVKEAPKPPAAGPAASWLHALKGIEFLFRADWVRSDGTRDRLKLSGTVHEEGPRLFLDLDIRTTYDLPSASSTVQEFRARRIPLIELNRGSEPYLQSARLEGDLVRQLAPTLSVTSTSRGQTTSLGSIDWRTARITLELRRFIRNKTTY